MKKNIEVYEKEAMQECAVSFPIGEKDLAKRQHYGIIYTKLVDKKKL